MNILGQKLSQNTAGTLLAVNSDNQYLKASAVNDYIHITVQIIIVPKMNIVQVIDCDHLVGMEK